VDATFVDRTRRTPATSAGPAASTRSLATTIWYPIDGKGSTQFPLVVWGHGYGLANRDYESLLQRWASSGYVIAAPNFPSSSSDRTGRGAVASTDDERSEPGDLSFVATSVIRLSAATTGPLAGRVDPKRLIAAGHSQGAADALAMTLADCCRDARVTAAIVVAGIDVPERFGTYRFSTGPAVMVEQGDRDRYLSVTGARHLYDRLARPKVLLVMHGTDHNTSRRDAGAPPTRLLADAIIDFANHAAKDGSDAALQHDVAADASAELSTAY
jgi:dienelactone hydrolase